MIAWSTRYSSVMWHDKRISFMPQSPSWISGTLFKENDSTLNKRISYVERKTYQIHNHKNQLSRQYAHAMTEE